MFLLVFDCAHETTRLVQVQGLHHSQGQLEQPTVNIPLPIPTGE